MMASDKEDTALDRLSSRQLPVLSSGVASLLESLSDENIDFLSLTRVIEQFPSIAGRLISVANSAWSAPKSTITSLEMACTRLGLGVVKSTSIALAVASPFDPGRCPAFDVVLYWCGALVTADAAALLASASHLTTELDPSAARSAGLLHNLGLLWLADQLPMETQQALLAIKENPSLSLGQTFIEITGFSHTEAGGHLAQAWQLPAPLAIAMRHYPESDFEGEHWEMSCVVGLARLFTTAVIRGEPCPEIDGCFKRLGISTDAAEKVFLDLNRQFEKTEALSKTLFGH